jgi:hypothetical protein
MDRDASEGRREGLPISRKIGICCTWAFEKALAQKDSKEGGEKECAAGGWTPADGA